MLSLTRPGSDRLEELRRAAGGDEPTYAPLGSTITGSTPAGFGSAAHHRYLSDADWDLARESVRSWAGHRAARIEIAPDRPPIRPGTDVAMAVPVLGLHVTAVCRIVAVVDEADSFGFAYGTLPHHPERGEEVFLVSRRPMGVRFEIRSFSRPNAWFTRIGAPIGSRLQALITERYLDGLTAASLPQA